MTRAASAWMAATTALLFTTSASAASASAPHNPLAAALAGLTGYLTLPDAAGIAHAGIGSPSYLGLVCGMTIGALIAFLFGRIAFAPLWRRWTASALFARLTSDPPLAMRLLRLALPPAPGNGPRGATMQRMGWLLALLVHLLPPPAPWWARLLVDAMLGMSTMRPAHFIAGTAAGISLHLVGRDLFLHHAPGAWMPDGPWLILLMIAPIPLTVGVRLWRMARRNSR